MSQRRSRKSNTQNTPRVEEAVSEELNPSLENAVKECARYIVCREGGKVPIKKEDISKHLITMCEMEKNQFSRVLSHAEKLLLKVYGYKLVKVDGNGTQYLVRLAEECESMPSATDDPQLRILLVAALTHIFMTGGTVKEEDMWKFLSEAGLLEENDFAGRKILTSTFTKQLYLTYTKIGEGDLAKYIFEWGLRAKEEVPKIILLNKMAEVFEKEPSHWHEQYKEATENSAT